MRTYKKERKLCMQLLGYITGCAEILLINRAVNVMENVAASGVNLLKIAFSVPIKTLYK